MTQTIHQKLTPINLPDPAQFDQAMVEIHEQEKGKQAQGASSNEPEPPSHTKQAEG